jgi:hypothetical protein
MELTQEQKQKIVAFIPTFKKYLKSPVSSEDLQSRHERSEMYSRLLSHDGIEQMTEIEFGQVISSLWASLMWGNKGYLVERLIQDNTLPLIKTKLVQLLWGDGSVAERYDAFRSELKGFGTAMITETMALVHPNECGLWNVKARTGLVALGFDTNTVPLKKSQISGDDYQRFNDVLRLIQKELIGKVEETLDLLGVDYFLYEIWRAKREQGDEVEVIQTPTATDITDFDHDEVIEQLVAIGEWMGFQAKKEQLIAKGAKVDALWQAQIANLGKVTYIFEVQRRGSLDSLILNLQRAQNNPSVQRLIIVANARDLSRVRQEIETLPESFRRMVSYMEVWEAKRAAELVSELSEIISKLELVKSEYGS